MFAATKGVGQRRLVTQTFTSNTTWVAPGVTANLETVSGYGGVAASDQLTSGEVGYAQALGPVVTPQPTPPYALWQTLDAAADNIVAIIAGNVGTNYISLPSPQYFVDSSDRYDVITYTSPRWIVGNSSTKVQRRSHPSTGNVLASQLASGGDFGWYVNASYIALGYAGQASTAFGRTFPGGTLAGTEPYRTAVPATTTTYTNVAVTPGASYAIVIGAAGGSITISYYA
jgi:hypothetical protein